MEYRIKQGDKFLCIKDFVMKGGQVAYTKGKVYLSEMRDALTDNEDDTLHDMSELEDFFEYFERVGDDKLICQLNEWIKDCQLQADFFVEMGMGISVTSSLAMKTAYMNVKMFIENNR
jgi:hypothetical protein